MSVVFKILYGHLIFLLDGTGPALDDDLHLGAINIVAGILPLQLLQLAQACDLVHVLVQVLVRGLADRQLERRVDRVGAAAQGVLLEADVAVVFQFFLLVEDDVEGAFLVVLDAGRLLLDLGSIIVLVLLEYVVW